VKDLSKHIEYLLLSNDCLIIPQFGAFVARYMTSEWSEKEEIFLPPYRLVHFNDNIRHNDNLLASSLMHMYRINQDEALKWIDEYVKYINEELLVNGSFDMGSIGILFKENDFSPISFSACQAGVVSPELYGLDSFQTSILPEEILCKTEKPAEKKKRLAFIEKDDTHITIRLNRKAVNVVSTIAACILLFFMFSTPVQNTSKTTDLSSNKELFFPRNLIPHQQTSSNEKKSMVETTVTSENKTKAEAASAKKENITASVTTELKNNSSSVALPNAQPTQKVAPAKPRGKYCIVMSSAVSKKNAEAYTAHLKKDGYNAEILDNGKIRRVIIGGFETEESCREQIKEMHKIKKYKDCWFMKLD